MIRCPRCDHFQLEGARECERCGATLAVETDEQILDPPPATQALDAQVLSIVATGGTIAAIKWHREQTGLGLKESKDAVERLMQRHNVSAPKSGCAGMVLFVLLTTSTLVAVIGNL